MTKISQAILVIIFLLLLINGCTPISQTSKTTPIIKPTIILTSPTLFEPTLTIVPTPIGKTIVVTSYMNDGPGTLRQALLDAISGDKIVFDTEIFPPESPTTIFLTTHGESIALPSITQGSLIIDASNAGVIIDGSKTSGEWVNCISIESNDNIIRGLQVINFPGSGFAFMNQAQNNILGGNRSVGVGPIGQGNLSAGNRTQIDLQGKDVSNNIITGNLIGVNSNGSSSIGIPGTGIYLSSGTSNNTIGPDNIIAFNSDGIQMNSGRSRGNTFTRNNIFQNENSGISPGMGNDKIASPEILGFDLEKGEITIKACSNCIVEVYSDEFGQGKYFEISGRTDDAGLLVLEKGTPFIGPYLTSLATDESGNSSSFSFPTAGQSASVPDIAASKLMQQNNEFPVFPLKYLPSSELEDNWMGTYSSSLWHLDGEPPVYPDGFLDAGNITSMGFKRFRFTINGMETPTVDWSISDFSISAEQDRFIDQLLENGVNLTYMLSYWDTDWISKGNQPHYPRFQTEEEIARYIEYVQFIVQHFNGKVSYYEVWNEPNNPDPAHAAQQIDYKDYINLVKRIVPIIRELDPKAKIVVGGTTSLINKDSQDYLFKVLNSDIMPLVDVISWHPMYGSSPAFDYHEQYYYSYPDLVINIKKTARANGFKGEFVADEIHWPIPSQPESGWPTYSNIQSAKYLTRSLLMHLGSDVTVTQNLLSNHPQQVSANQYLSTIMSGFKPLEIPISINKTDFPLASYGFILPNGEKLLAIWDDGIAVDYDLGIETTITIPNDEGWKATGIDVINGIEQTLVSSNENGSLMIKKFMIKDYPLIIRLSKE